MRLKIYTIESVNEQKKGESAVKEKQFNCLEVSVYLVWDFYWYMLPSLFYDKNSFKIKHLA